MDCNYFLKSLLEQNLDLIKTTKYGLFIFMKSSEIHEISNQISKLNQELTNVIEIKADLAMTQAIKSGIKIKKKNNRVLRGA